MRRFVCPDRMGMGSRSGRAADVLAT